MAKKFTVGLENDGAEIETPDLLESPSESVESDLVEITGLDKEIESLVEAGEELEEDQATTEELIENAEESLEEDGMDEVAARATEIAAESIAKRWNLTRRKTALEAHGSADTRRQATRVAVEGLKDMASNMWETFVKWVKEIVAKGKEQLLALTNAGKKIKARAEKLEKRLAAGLGVQEKKEVEGSFTKQLAVDEKADYQECLKFADSSANTVDKIGKAVMTGIDQTGKLMRAGEVKSEGGATMELITGDFGKKTSKKLNVPQGAENVAVVALPGNCYLMKFTQDGVTKTSYEVATDKVKDGKLPTLSDSECKAGATALYKIGEVLEAKLKAFRDANDKMEKLADEAKKAKANEKDATSENRKELSKATAIARANINSAKAAERAVTSSLKNAAGGIYGYVAASIGAYKKA